jgi:hypothetical protein
MATAADAGAAQHFARRVGIDDYRDRGRARRRDDDARVLGRHRSATPSPPCVGSAAGDALNIAARTGPCARVDLPLTERLV